MNHSKYNKDDLRPFHEGVSASVFDKDDKLLLLEHNKLGIWTPVVGKVDVGDSVTQTLHKELFEETTLTIETSDKVMELGKWMMRDGVLVNVMCHLFVVRAHGVAINAEPNKHKSIKWVRKDELLRMDPETVLIDAFITGREVWGGF